MAQIRDTVGIMRKQVHRNVSANARGKIPLLCQNQLSVHAWKAPEVGLGARPERSAPSLQGGGGLLWSPPDGGDQRSPHTCCCQAEPQEQSSRPSSFPPRALSSRWRTRKRLVWRRVEEKKSKSGFSSLLPAYRCKIHTRFTYRFTLHAIPPFIQHLVCAIGQAEHATVTWELPPSAGFLQMPHFGHGCRDVLLTVVGQRLPKSEGLLFDKRKAQGCRRH